MTRIIAGSARGRRLRVPKGDSTRPTTDRVRESLFATVEHRLGGLVDAHVLDLFAGSGALGLEAASRGATRVVLVERDRAAAAVAKANVGVVGRAGVEVVVASVAAYLAGPVPASGPFDLVLADPPYAVAGAEVTGLLATLGTGWLQPDALVVVERSARSEPLTWPEGLVPVRQARYGETTLWYGACAADREDR